MSSPEASPSDSSTSPPPPSDDSSASPPPPSDDSSASPPPPSDDSSASPPPPSDDSSASPPPPSDDSSSSPPPPSDDSSASPPPPSDGSTESPPPPSDGSTESPRDDSNSSPPGSDNGGSSANSPDRSPSRPSPPKSNHGNSERGSGGDRETPRLSNDKHKSKDHDSKGNSIITGVAAAMGLLLLIAILFMVTCSRRRKKKRKARLEMKYYMDNNPRANTSNNYWQNEVPNWHKDAAGNKMPPSGISSEHKWHMAPPPPPPMMSSSDLSSTGYSGPHQAPLPPPHPVMAMGYNQSSFAYEDLAAATDGFAQTNLLGQGGFGYVHKGVLPNGKEIAVKSLKANSGQGEREFQAEVDIISRVHHRHLVSLVGYCIAGSQRMLVYEFVPNGNLEYHLHGSGPSMDWPTRLKIALGSAKGFAYLHEDCHPRIIHRDIKAANILLDENFEAKVADFGLAKLSSDTFTHVSTRIMGTFGYLAPEYASTGKLTEKSDCYSYGIMLLELITGRRPIDINSDDDDGLVDWARPILVRAGEGGSFEEMVDPRLGNNYDRQEMLRAMLSAAACIRHSARRRPKMSQIVRALEGDVSLDDLSGSKTAQIAMFGSSGSESDLKRLGGGTSSREYSNSEDGSSQEMRSNRNSPRL